MLAMIRSAFVDAVPLMRSRALPYVAMAVLCAVAGALLPVLTTEVSDARAVTQVPWLQFDLDIVVAICVLAVFFVYPNVARSARSEFRMTVGRFFGIIGISLAVCVESVLGFAAFIIAGFWITVKWSLSVWTYLLTEGKNPLNESWQLTNGQFWETFGFSLLLGFTAGVPMVVGILGVLGNAGAEPLVGIVLRPIAFLIYVYALHVYLLGQMHWMLRLRNRALYVSVGASA